MDLRTDRAFLNTDAEQAQAKPDRLANCIHDLEFAVVACDVKLYDLLLAE